MGTSERCLEVGHVRVSEDTRCVPPARMTALQEALAALGKAQRRVNRLQAELVDDFDITADEVLTADGQIVPRPAGPAG